MQLGEVDLSQEQPTHYMQETPSNKNYGANSLMEQNNMFERNNQAMHGSILQGMMGGKQVKPFDYERHNQEGLLYN